MNPGKNLLRQNCVQKLMALLTSKTIMGPEFGRKRREGDGRYELGRDGGGCGGGGGGTTARVNEQTGPNRRKSSPKLPPDARDYRVDKKTAGRPVFPDVFTCEEISNRGLGGGWGGEGKGVLQGLLLRHFLTPAPQGLSAHSTRDKRPH